MLNRNLMTDYAQSLDKNNILCDYPRPQFKRESYLCLNGEWDYRIENKSSLVAEGKILVPFPIESALSGVNRALKKEETLIYTRRFTLNKDFLRDICLLHIGAADQLAEVWVNGICAGKNEGGYLPFSFDITDMVHSGENELVVRIKDSLSYLYPTGKQREKRGGIWYTPISGIWQTVFIESVPRSYIRSLRITADIDTPSVKLEIDRNALLPCHVHIGFKGNSIYEGKLIEKSAVIQIPPENLHLWSPENPALYDLQLQCGEDKVSSYFAMRKFEAKKGCFYLNNKPYFVNGLLDQGYFSDGIYTPASYKAFYDDISKMKALGFNALRKHIKIEPMEYYHACDTLGMLVLQDMVNVGRYSFFKDTVLPFSGLCKKLPYVNVNKKQREMFRNQALATVDALYSCPCVVYYTIFNEGWGQFDGDEMYALLKKADPSRVYDSTSGWFHQKLSDVDSFHIYFKPIKATVRYDKTKAPWIVSEFGGYSYRIAEHAFNPDKEFGYRKYNSRAEFEKAFQTLYEKEILGNISNGLAGAIYTQLSDVEDETNGILSYDRKVCKLSTDSTSALMQKLFRCFHELHRE